MHSSKPLIIVTGSAGQLGHCIQDIAPLHPHLHFEFTDVDRLDITHPHALEQYLKENDSPQAPSLLINCAAYTAVDKAESDAQKALLLNTRAVEYLAHSCHTLECMMIQISTDYVFDGKGYMPYTTTDTKNPQSVYGNTKSEAEDIVCDILGDHALVLRTAWLYSPYCANFALTMLRLAKEKEIVKVVDDQIGSPTYAPHLAQILCMITDCALKERSFRTRYLHYTDAGVCSWYDFAHSIISQSPFASRCKVLPIPSSDYPVPAKRPFYSVLSKQEIQHIYGVTPTHWSVGVTEFLNKI